MSWQHVAAIAALAFIVGMAVGIAVFAVALRIEARVVRRCGWTLEFDTPAARAAMGRKP